MFRILVVTTLPEACCFKLNFGIPTLSRDLWTRGQFTAYGESLTSNYLYANFRSSNAKPSRPDNCDGTYESYCDSTREYTNITAIIDASGSTDLLDYMNVFWKDYKGDDEDFWEHEWGKHGTCISTLERKCYSSNDAPQQDVLDYFKETVELFKGLDSYSVRISCVCIFHRLCSCCIKIYSIYLLPASSQARPRHIRPLR